MLFSFEMMTTQKRRIAPMSASANQKMALPTGRATRSEEVASQQRGLGLGDLEWSHKWVILRMTPTALLSYHSCKKHEGARVSITLLEDFDPVSQMSQNVNTVRRNNVC